MKDLEKELGAALNGVVRDSLKPVLVGLSGLYVVFALAHPFFLPAEIAATMSFLAAATAALFLALRLLMSRWTIPVGWAHPAGALVAAVVLANTLVLFHLRQEARETTTLMLLILGAGCFVLSPLWLALIIAMTVAGWAALVWAGDPSPEKTHFAFALFSATALSVLIFIVRYQNLSRLHALRRHDELRQRELEQALDLAQSEVSERKQVEEALNRAHAELEQRVVERTAELGETNRQLELRIEERTRADEALRGSEERYRVVTESARDAIISIDDQSRIVFVNRAAEEIFGYRANEMLGQPLTMLMPESLRSRHRASLQRYVETGVRHIPGASVAMPGRHKTGREIHLEISFGEFRKDGQHLFTGVMRDVTERKFLEERLRQTARLEAVGELAGGVAHEFNNALTGIIGYTELVRQDCPPGSHMSKDLARVLNLAKKSARLTHQLLAFSQRQFLQPELLDLNEVIEKMIPMVQSLLSRGTDLEFTPAPDLGKIKADRGQMEDVVVNLVLNARDAMPEGGRLSIETANALLDGNASQDQPPGLTGSFVILSVADTGLGMDKATRGRIFEPFFTTKEVGKAVGLGLSSAQGIIAQHGGLIVVQSEAGRGSVFRIYLPHSTE